MEMAGRNQRRQTTPREVTFSRKQQRQDLGGVDW